jgi:predicted pyridoxine 5'-phosphate oxidase superfamily flavin-nucleotide-binding protein
VQYDLLELRVEAQRVGPRAVVAREVTRLENGLPSILRNDAATVDLDADQNDFFARVAYPAPGAVDDLPVGTDTREVHLVALGGGDLAEKRRFGNRATIQLDEGVANRVAPELKSPCLGNRRGRQNDLHRPPRSLQPGQRLSQRIGFAIAAPCTAPGNNISCGYRQARLRRCVSLGGVGTSAGVGIAQSAVREQAMSLYHGKQRELQDAFDTRRLADVIESSNVHDTLNPLDEAFIVSKDFFFLATADSSGKPSCSFKAGPAGFVKIVDERTLAFPCYDGNGMYLSMGNVLANPRIGMLFLDFEKPNRLRVSGEASIAETDSLLAEYPEAQFIVRVAVTEIFLNCPRYIPKFKRVADSPFVPVAGKHTPFPNWKQIDFVRESLPERDRQKAMQMPAIDIMDYIKSIEES